MSRSPDSARRSLAAASDEISALRAGGMTVQEARGYVLRVANSVDRTLRRLLRDDERAPMEVRLQALAPDEIDGDAVLAELRRTERLTMPTAAAIHDLFELRGRLERGSFPAPDDGRRVIAAVDRLEAEIDAPPAPAAAASVGIDETVDDLPVEPPPRSRHRRAAGVPLLPIAAVLLTALAAFGAWAVMGRGSEGMDQGIALFRSGAYADAAHHFWRYAEENPDDATPHLYLARIHRRMNRPELAAEALREAQRLAPEDPAVHRELGFLLVDTGQPEVAIERFREAIEMEPGSSEGWVGLVRAMREAGRGDEVDAAIRDAPAEVQALLSRGGEP